jgi:hypothetical protein
LPVVGFGEDHLDRTDRPWGVDDHQSPRDDAPAEGHQHPCAGPRKSHLVDQQPDQPPPRPQWLVRGAVWGRGWRGRRSSPRSNRHAPDGDLGRLDVARAHTRMALVTASPKPGPARRQPRPGWRQAVAASWFARHAAARQGRSANRQPRLPAIARCRRCGRHGLAEGPAGPGGTAPSPDEGGGGLAPAQPLPAAEPASRHHHGPLRLGQRRP